MSVYSGFATRQQESYYNKLIEKVFLLLSDRIIKLSIEERICQDPHFYKWIKCINKIYAYMANAEKVKYMEPKLSYSLRPLILHFQMYSEGTQKNELQETEHANRIMAKNRKTVINNRLMTHNDSMDNSVSQSLWLDQSTLPKKPSTASQAAREQFSETNIKNRFVPMTLKHTLEHNTTIARGASVETHSKKQKESLINTILKYAQ